MSNMDFDYLSGPVSWYEFEFKDDTGKKKMIHFFGDKHDLNNLCNPSLKCMKNKKSPKSNCYDFIYFLKELFKIVVENQKYADLFLEFPYNIQRKDVYNVLQNTIIGKIYNQFKDCFQYTKKECKYLPYVRMHYTDLRDAFQEDVGFGYVNYEHKIGSHLDLLYFLIDDIVQDFAKVRRNPDSSSPLLTLDQRINRINMIDILFEIIQNYCRMYEILLGSKNYIKDLSQFIEPFVLKIKEYPDEFNLDEVKIFMNVFELMKQLKHPKKNMSILAYQLDQLKQDEILVQGKNVSDLIYDFVMGKCFQKIVGLQEFLDYWKDLSQGLSKVNNNAGVIQIYNYLDEFSKNINYFLITSVGPYILDAYILSRLFRNFSGKDHYPSILSIVYAGDSHINIEVEFFEKVLKLSPVNQVKKSIEESQCIFSPKLKDIFDLFDGKLETQNEQNFDNIINDKNFKFLYQGKDGMLIKPKDIGPLCDLLPNLVICESAETTKLSEYNIWIDSNDDKKYVLNFNEDEYKDEENEDLDKDTFDMLQSIKPVYKLFENHENELLKPSDKKLQLAYEKNPKQQAKKLFFYTQDILGKRWKQAEEKIILDPEYATNYAIVILKSRWPNEMTKKGENLKEKAEATISQNKQFAKKYAEHFNLSL